MVKDFPVTKGVLQAQGSGFGERGGGSPGRRGPSTAGKARDGSGLVRRGPVCGKEHDRAPPCSSVLRRADPERQGIRLRRKDLAKSSGTAKSTAASRRESSKCSRDSYEVASTHHGRAGRSLREPMIRAGHRVAAASRRPKVKEMLGALRSGLPGFVDPKRYPHAFSGGQRQRLGLSPVRCCSDRQ